MDLGARFQEEPEEVLCTEKKHIHMHSVQDVMQPLKTVWEKNVSQLQVIYQRQ